MGQSAAKSAEIKMCLVGLSIFLLLITTVLAFTSKLCEIPNETTSGYCVEAGDCRPYQRLKSNATLAGPETERFLKQLDCFPAGVCCTPMAAYADPRVHVHVYKRAASEDPFANCGMEAFTDRIIGGTATKIDEFPWLALLFYLSKETGMLHPACGGALITKRWVLTAGHCVTGRGYTKLGPLQFVRLGEHNLDTEPDCEALDDGMDCADPPLDFQPEKMIPHPDYVSISWDKYNDVALIKLEKDAPYTDFIRPICLPSFYNVSENGFKGVSMYAAAGWGQTDYYQTVGTIPSKVKLKVSVPHVENARCRTIYNEFSLRISDSQICAGGQKAKDTCRGDSGSPLMFFNRQHARWFAYGIVSRGPSNCGTEGVPSVYSNMFTFDDWVRSTMAAN